MNNSTIYQLQPEMHLIVTSLMESEGRDFTTCEQCGKPTGGHPEIHHTKYAGATYYDLEIVCRSCNRIAKNVGLD